HLFQPVDLLTYAADAPVGHLPIELVTSRLRGEERVRLEVVLDEARGELAPGCLRSDLRIWRRRRLDGGGLTAAAASDQNQSRQDGARAGQPKPHESLREAGT